MTRTSSHEARVDLIRQLDDMVVSCQRAGNDVEAAKAKRLRTFVQGYRIPGIDYEIETSIPEGKLLPFKHDGGKTSGTN